MYIYIYIYDIPRIVLMMLITIIMIITRMFSIISICLYIHFLWIPDRRPPQPHTPPGSSALARWEGGVGPWGPQDINNMYNYTVYYTRTSTVLGIVRVLHCTVVYCTRTVRGSTRTSTLVRIITT